MTSAEPRDIALPEPAPSAVWTRRRPAWKLGLRAATASLGTCAPALYMVYHRAGMLSWRGVLALDVGLAVAVGAIAMARPWAGRVRLGTRFGAMLESPAIIPWFVGASLCALAGLAAVAAASGGSMIIGLITPIGGAVAWSWAFMRWWERRQPSRHVSAPPSPPDARD